MEHDIMTLEEYALSRGMIKVKHGHYKTSDGRAYIEQWFLGGKANWYVFNSNGDIVGVENNLALATNVAMEV